MVRRLLQFWVWLNRGNCTIRDIHEREVPLIPNRAQTLLFLSWLLQALAGKPVRTVVLKARKVGISTFVQALNYFLCKHHRQQIAKTVAHQRESTHEIFGITATIARRDIGPMPPKPTRERLEFHATESRYGCQTAGAEGVGAGGTPNLLHLSEVALWKMNKVETHYSATTAVPMTPTSVIVEESTARGRELFWDLFEAAHDPAHPYEPVFVPWFFDDALKAPVDDGFTWAQDERALGARALEYGITVTDAQLAWRRLKLADLGEALFKQEYPSTPQEAVEGQKGRVLPGLGDCLVSRLPFETHRIAAEDRVGGYDYGFNDPAALIAGIVWDGVLYVIDLWRGTEFLADHLADERIIHRGHTYYCDPSGPGQREELMTACRRKGIKAEFVQAPTGRGTGRDVQDDDQWDKVRRTISSGKLKILDSAADQLLLESDNFLFSDSTGRPEKIRNKTVGHMDCLDALRYMISGAGLESTRTPFPASRKPTRRELLRA